MLPSILLVDDSTVARHAVAAQLAAAGYDVQQAESVTHAKTFPLEGIACAIVDIDLPDGDGPTLAAALRIVSPSLPIAFFTGGASAELLDRARAIGPVYLKPDVEPLLAWVSSQPQPPPTK